jgi:hypothetical protein
MIVGFAIGKWSVASEAERRFDIVLEMPAYESLVILTRLYLTRCTRIPR